MNPERFTSDSVFPRNLSLAEKELLFSVLPSERKGYKAYREKIEALFVVGLGRFGNTNLILGEKTSLPDFSAPSAPVFAAGAVSYKGKEIYILVHEEFESQIEIDISGSETFDNTDIKNALGLPGRWTYSSWLPGQKAPGDDSELREIHLVKDQVVLAIAPEHKRLWVYESTNGVNHLLPVTNFYNELMIFKAIRDPKISLNSNLFFSDHTKYSDQEIASAFLIYNKFRKKVDLDYSKFVRRPEIKKSGWLSAIFKRG